MRRLSKQKKQQLLLTVLVTLTVLTGIWFGLIRVQQQSIVKVKEKTVAARKQLDSVKTTITRAEEIEASLTQGREVLSQIEENMADGDLYAWLITRIREFKTPYRIDIPQFSQINGPRPVDILPAFPYKQAGLTIAGTGRFSDIGMFICDFENQHPFWRLSNVVLEPATAGTAGDNEKLSFRMDVLALVKPAGTALN